MNQNALRICWHTPRLMSHGCGLSRRVLGLASGLVRRGHQVRLIVPEGSTDIRSDAHEGISITRVNVPRGRSLHWSLQAAQRRQRADAIVRLCPPDGDVVVTCQPEFAAAVMRAQPWQRVIVVACCAQLLYEPIERIENRMRPWPSRVAYELNGALLRRYERDGMNAAAAVCFDSAMTRTVTQDTYELRPERCHVLNPTVDVQRMVPASRRQRLETRHLLGIPDDAFTLCWTGRMEDRKNVSALLKAVASDPEAVDQLLLVGDGTDREAMEALAEKLNVMEKVRFVGMQTHVMRYLWASDAFVFPSLVDSFGIAVIEAMACGLPCIAVASPKHGIYNGAGESILDGVTGFIVPDDDARRLADRFAQLARKPELAKRMGMAGRERAVMRFAHGTDARHLEQVILKVCDHARV